MGRCILRLFVKLLAPMYGGTRVKKETRRGLDPGSRNRGEHTNKVLLYPDERRLISSSKEVSLTKLLKFKSAIAIKSSISTCDLPEHQKHTTVVEFSSAEGLNERCLAILFTGVGGCCICVLLLRSLFLNKTSQWMR